MTVVLSTWLEIVIGPSGVQLMELLYIVLTITILIGQEPPTYS